MNILVYIYGALVFVIYPLEVAGSGLPEFKVMDTVVTIVAHFPIAVQNGCSLKQIVSENETDLAVKELPKVGRWSR